MTFLLNNPTKIISSSPSIILGKRVLRSIRVSALMLFILTCLIKCRSNQEKNDKFQFVKNKQKFAIGLKKSLARAMIQQHNGYWLEQKRVPRLTHITDLNVGFLGLLY
jgi:hypothetical protein